MTIEEKENEMTKRVFQKLSVKNIGINMIFTNYKKDGLLRDGTRKEILSTVFIEPVFDITLKVISDSETLEMLYVQTAPTRFMEIDDFFKLRVDIEED